MVFSRGGRRGEGLPQPNPDEITRAAAARARVTAVAFHPTRPVVVASVVTDGIGNVGEPDGGGGGERPAGVGRAPEGARSHL